MAKNTKVIFLKQDVEAIVDLYTNTNNSTRDIAKIYNCSYNTINKLLKNNNVQMQCIKKISAKALNNTYRVGFKASDETKKRNSIAMKKRKPTTLGKIYTEEQRNNISKGLKLAYSTKEIKGKVGEARLVGVDKINKARNKCKNLLRRILSLTGSKKVTKTYDALGYTEKELLNHISSKFKEGMSWESRETFHIDHIVPVSWYIKNGITDPKIINALDNLQPLYPQENRMKSDSYVKGIV